MSDWAAQIFKSFEREFNEDIAGNLGEQSILLRACESPIERAFGVAFMLVHGVTMGRPSISGYFLSAAAPQVFMIPQFQFDRFRVDFLIGWNIGDHLHTSIVVECDGHDFHEKTKEQAARDKSRDRMLSAQFARVLRFSGSEIYANPVGCAMQVQGISDELFWSWTSRDEV